MKSCHIQDPPDPGAKKSQLGGKTNKNMLMTRKGMADMVILPVFRAVRSARHECSQCP